MPDDDGPALDSDASTSPTARGELRALIEFVVLLGIGVLIARVFVAEAFIVPTGSMAPTLLGAHRDLTCPGCAFPFALGSDDAGQPNRPACPNCGQSQFDADLGPELPGDRLLVHKFLFSLRPPRRWEMVVFDSPEEPGQPFVKRVVGRPGEQVAIRNGDVWIDGHPARKSLAQQRALRQLVYDHDYPGPDADRFPRFAGRRGPGPLPLGTGWQAAGTGFTRQATPDDGPGAPVDWLEYRHQQPGRQTAGPVLDFSAYNGLDEGGQNRVDDLMLVADLEPGPDCPALQLQLDLAGRRWRVTLPVADGRTPPAATCDGTPLPIEAAGLPALRPGRAVRLEASVFDQRLLVALDGTPVFGPIDRDEPAQGPVAPGPRLALGVMAGSVRVEHLAVYRDVYYTATLGSVLRRPFGVDAPYSLGPGEYFVLGDNSAVSNDSRFWSGSPVVRADRLQGRPFLVHLPGRTVSPTGLGHWLSRVPDLRAIRYIR